MCRNSYAPYTYDDSILVVRRYTMYRTIHGYLLLIENGLQSLTGSDMTSNLHILHKI